MAADAKVWLPSAQRALGLQWTPAGDTGDSAVNEREYERYSRHLLLPEIGRDGQIRLLESRVLIIGLGGLGSPAALYLAAAGIGHIVLADFDRVELSNLQRQIIHGTSDLGRHKVDSARDRMQAINPGITVTALPQVLDGDDLLTEVTQADVVVDASDNFETRFQTNAASVRAQTPLVSGAAIRMEAQVCTFQPALSDSPCYRCLYTDASGEGETCSETGVLAPLLGIIGSLQATETIKLLLGIGTSLTGRLLVIDALHMEWRTLRLRKDPRCPVCRANRSDERYAQSS